jgi:hypothetical protein
MRKTLILENLETGARTPVVVVVERAGEGWQARMETSLPGTPAPIFYGFTPEQAERQLRKVLEKDAEVVEQKIDDSPAGKGEQSHD